MRSEPDYSQTMFVLTGQSIFAHSRSSTSGVFCLLIIKAHSMIIGKIKPLEYYNAGEFIIIGINDV